MMVRNLISIIAATLFLGAGVTGCGQPTDAPQATQDTQAPALTTQILAEISVWN